VEHGIALGIGLFDILERPVQQLLAIDRHACSLSLVDTVDVWPVRPAASFIKLRHAELISAIRNANVANETLGGLVAGHRSQ
ncbi:hypothetical protein, partial [Klebsiella michiganensis]|uniref:hypothetical protein n=2 Tax=Klebsiella TaxID=570 RepID=UPI001952A44A